MTPALRPVAAELERLLGLNPAAVGDRLLARAVEARMAATGAGGVADYLLKLTDAERAALTDAVVVPETWVLRYPESFAHLAGRQRGKPAVRVLCVPCSTGEEAFGVALTLLDAGVARPEVLAVDVSPRAVAAARVGVCGEASFRDAAGRAARDRHFDRVDGGWQPKPLVRQAVSVRVGNLSQPDFLADEPPFDAVFCRNLFIYLTPAARGVAVGHLGRLLKPGGTLYMGHAEPVGLADDRFRPVPPPAAFAFERNPRSQAPPVPPQASPPLIAPGRSSRGFAPHSPPAAPVDPLSAARAAADRGDPRAAADLLAAAPPSADGFALLGVVRTMLNDPAAADAAFTRALFLDPAHPAALLHKLAAAEARGDTAAVANYRRRLARADR
jgi:chemotaxis protein methyltransferase WspC